MTIAPLAEVDVGHKAFLVHHSHSFDDGTEDVKPIGVYSTRVAAQSAVQRVSVLKGFANNSDGFSIDEYEIDRDHWTEGYVTARK